MQNNNLLRSIVTDRIHCSTEKMASLTVVFLMAVGVTFLFSQEPSGTQASAAIPFEMLPKTPSQNGDRLTTGQHPETVSDDSGVGNPWENGTFVETMILSVDMDSRVSRSYSGILKARRSTELGFRRTGLIQHVAIEEGDTVVQGAVLAELDTTALQAELQVAIAQRDAATALLRELTAGPRSQTIAAARARVTEAEALRNQAGILSERRSSLAGSAAISAQEIDDARYQLMASEGRLTAQKHELDQLLAGTRTEQLDAQQAEVKRMNAIISSLQVQLDQSQLRAPFDSVVSRRLVDEGGIVAPGVPVIRIVEQAPYEAWIGLPPKDAAELAVNQTYSLTIQDTVRTGRLKTILPELDPSTRTQTVILTLTEDQAMEGERTGDSAVALGQIVQLNLSQRIEQKGFWVPMSALVRGNRGLWSVYRIVQMESEQTVQRADVEVIQIDSSRVLLRGTISAGDQIVTSGVQKLTSGQRVRPRAADKSTASIATP